MVATLLLLRGADTDAGVHITLWICAANLVDSLLGTGTRHGEKAPVIIADSTHPLPDLQEKFKDLARPGTSEEFSEVQLWTAGYPAPLFASRNAALSLEQLGRDALSGLVDGISPSLLAFTRSDCLYELLLRLTPHFTKLEWES